MALLIKVEIQKLRKGHSTEIQATLRFTSGAPQHTTRPSKRITPAVAATTRIRQWRHDAGVLGSLPFAVCAVAAHADTRVPFCLWQLGSFLFGMPARGPSRPLLVGFRVAALALGPPLHGGR